MLQKDADTVLSNCTISLKYIKLGKRGANISSSVESSSGFFQKEKKEKERENDERCHKLGSLLFTEPEKHVFR